MSEITEVLATSHIVSLAFLAMEKTPPASFADDSPEAALTERFYPVALQRTLERTDWSFASTYAELPQMTLPSGVATDPALPYAYAFPGDALQLREVGDGRTRWRVDGMDNGRAIRADLSAPLPVRYTAKLQNEEMLPASFRDAVAYQLAIYLAPHFLGTQAKIAELEGRLERALKTAMREDARAASEARYDGLSSSLSDDWVTQVTR